MIDDVRRLEQQADELRAEGRLDAAAKACAELLAIAPDHLKAERLLSCLAGRESVLPSAPGLLKPAPFVVVRQLLPPEVHDDALLTCFLLKAGEFESAATTCSSTIPTFGQVAGSPIRISLASRRPVRGLFLRTTGSFSSPASSTIRCAL